MTADEAGQRVLTILSCAGDYPDGRLDFPLGDAPALAPGGAVHLAAEVCGAALQFFADSGGGWQPLDPVLDASIVSDEGGRGAHSSFTGALVGMIAFDTAGSAVPAEFLRFEYRPLSLPPV